MGQQNDEQAELVADFLDEVMPMLSKHQVILLFDSWYAKKNIVHKQTSIELLMNLANAGHAVLKRLLKVVNHW